MPVQQDRTNNGSLPSHQVLSVLNRYIPSLVLKQLVERQEKQAAGPGQNDAQTQQLHLPELQSMETAVMFADISGFTKVSEACASRGIRGNEELSFCINRYMEGMVRNLGKYGGDIIKFVGDAMIIMWPPENQNNASTSAREDPAELIIRKAIQCAVDIQKDMNNFKVIAGVSSLSVKIGIGYGNCALLYVGGVFNRAEFFTVGQALTRALASEGQATGGGQIIVNESAFKLVKKFYDYAEKLNDGGELFYRDPVLKKTAGGVKTRAEAHAIRSNITTQMFNKIQVQLKGCIPNAIIPYISISAEKFGSETRSLTVMFASLGVELSSAETQAGMEKIQKIVTTVQEQVYRLQGSVNKLVMDDKGSTLICLWGLSPLAHEDDAARALLTALNMRRELNAIEGTWCNIGVSSGELFSGVVGTSGGRKEFSVLGDVANLAARVMYWPKSKGAKNKVHCCLTTRQLASNFFNFRYAGHQEFKGKSISIPIFEPTDPREERASMAREPLSADVFIKIHQNAMILESSKPQKSSGLEMIGQAQQMMEELEESIVNYFLREDNDSPYFVAIQGRLGSGKSHFARALIDSLVHDSAFTGLCYGEESEANTAGKIPIFCSSLNAELAYEFLGIWKPILQQMMTYYSRRNRVKRDQALKQVLCTGEGIRRNADKTEVLCKLLGVDMATMVKSYPEIDPGHQIGPRQQEAQFVKSLLYAEEHCEEIIRLVSAFIKLVNGDEEVSDDEDTDAALRSPQGRTAGKHGGAAADNMAPIMVVLDTAHLMGPASWQLLYELKQYCTRLCIILLLQTNYLDEIKIAPASAEAYQVAWSKMDDLKVIDLPSLTVDSLEKMLRAYASRYQMSYIDEISKMIEILDTDSTIKTPEEGRQWKKVLTKRWQTSQKFDKVTPVVSQTIVKKCDGNPLLCLSYFVCMVQNGFLEIDSNGVLQPRASLNQCLRVNDFTQIPVPRIANKMICAAIDSFVAKVVQKQSKRPQELENVMRAIVMMKAACVLGEEFDLNSLMAILPLSGQYTRASTADLIKTLELIDFLEVLDESDGDNLQVRFNKSFLRETLYQIILYREQKDNLHKQTARFFLNDSTQTFRGTLLKKPTIQLQVLKRHLLASQDVEDESLLSYENRTGLQVRHIQNLLCRNERKIVLQENLKKQGQGANQNTSARLCTLDATNFRWYHDADEFKAGTYLGSIPVYYIYQTVASSMARGQDPAFSISSSQWNNKKRQEEGPRDFFFACDSYLQMEQWIISIEFLRVKAVYDAYALKNIPVSFPIKLGNKERKKAESNDTSELLFDFGTKLKLAIGQGSSVSTSNGSAFANLRASGKRSGSISKRDSILQNPSNALGSGAPNPIKPDDLVSCLKSLYSVGVNSLQRHVRETACKMTVKQRNIQVGNFPLEGGALHVQVAELNETLGIDSLASARAQSAKWSGAGDRTPLQQEPSLDQQRSLAITRHARRKSSVSADGVSSKLDGGVQSSSKHIRRDDLIKEESEGTTSEDMSSPAIPNHQKQGRTRPNRPESSHHNSNEEGASQRSHSNDVSQMIAMHASNDMSSSNQTPPLSIAAAKTSHNQTLERHQSPPLQQNWRPNKEERLIETQKYPRNQAPPQAKQLKVSQKSQLVIEEAPQKQYQPRVQAEEQKQALQAAEKEIDAESGQSMLQTLQQFITSAIESNIGSIVKQNKEIVQHHKEEISQLLREQQVALQQSIYSQQHLDLSNEEAISRGDPPALRYGISSHRVHQLLNSSGGITKTSNRNLLLQQMRPHQHYEDDQEQDDGLLDDPEAEVNNFTAPVGDSRAIHSFLDLSRSQQFPASPEEVSVRQRFGAGGGLTEDDSVVTQKRDPMARSQQRPKPTNTMLLHFPEEKMYFPPPEPWQRGPQQPDQLVKRSNKQENDISSVAPFSQNQSNEESATGEGGLLSMVVATKDSHCQLQGQELVVHEGEVVQIVDSIPQIKMYKIRMGEQLGVFPMRDFSRIPSKARLLSAEAIQPPTSIASPVPPEPRNFFKETPAQELQLNMARMTPEQMAAHSRRILTTDRIGLKKTTTKVMERQKRRQKQVSK